MNPSTFTGAAIAVVACITSTASSATVIDFSKDAAGNPLAALTTIDEQYAAIGVHFIGSAFDGFATNTDMRLTTAGGDVPPGAVFPAGVGNFLHTYSGFTAEDGDANFAIVFDQPVSSVSIDFYDDKVGLTQIFAYETLDSADFVDDAQTLASDSMTQTLSLSAPGGFTLVAVLLGANDDWVAADNVSFTPLPEPGSLLLGASSFVLVRRRQC